MNASRVSALMNRAYNPNPEIAGTNYNDANPLNTPLRMQVDRVEIGESKASGKEGVFVYFNNLTSGLQFTHFNSINAGQEGYIDLMFSTLGSDAPSWGDCIKDLNTRKPVFEVELYRDPRNTDFIRPRFLRTLSKGNVRVLAELTRKASPMKPNPAARSKAQKSDPTEGII